MSFSFLSPPYFIALMLVVSASLFYGAFSRSKKDNIFLIFSYTTFGFAGFFMAIYKLLINYYGYQQKLITIIWVCGNMFVAFGIILACIAAYQKTRHDQNKRKLFIILVLILLVLTLSIYWK